MCVCSRSREAAENGEDISEAVQSWFAKGRGQNPQRPGCGYRRARHAERLQLIL